MKRRKNNSVTPDFREAFLNTTELFATDPVIEIQSNHHAVIQGSKGIIEYGDDIIRVSLSQMEVRIYGEQLSIGCLSQDGLEIKGKILRIEYI